MYRVVGCRDCGAMWIVAERPETTTCPRCGTRYRFEALQAFAETEDEAAARAARTALLADRTGHEDVLADLDGVTAGQLDATGVDDEADLEAVGLDPEEIAAAGDRAGTSPPRLPDRRETVLAAVEALDRPTEAEVVTYAAERDVPAEAARGQLSRLVRVGEVSESGGRYRRL